MSRLTDRNKRRIKRETEKNLRASHKVGSELYAAFYVAQCRAKFLKRVELSWRIFWGCPPKPNNGGK